ncbi:GNAT family N-acetyltransferase [Paucisalibacillus globulus]|uniref:GNAT family N-acetyltransferase n=1 Tax=Paucisalibacillus globulus TaxID=351095 RepID=UPI00040CD8A2|nr:GNAT family N-acetyltransferase [Paucisalibacillus globulus]
MNIEIVKYDESYAARVADMWNHSRDGWGGSTTIDTEESILHREANSTNLHTFLALEGEKVVGYCGFSEYRDDEGALYIPLLNVRDDYHGKKIGKKLLLTALQEAIHLKWPRLDLYTWAGNTKAVPLYKRCGFFWEDRDDTTHLMNFMPTVLHTEAVRDFFCDASWYDMSTREIEVKPDGRVENDFHYFEYSWEKENESLRMEFERTGRGIRLIETNDYAISATVENHALVFGNQYTIQYAIRNKSGKPLHLDLTGINDKNITFSLEESLEVVDKAEITGTFLVGPIQEEQDTFKTHPTVKTNIKINGKQATLKVGILPKYPAMVTAHLSDDLTFVGKKNTFYVDMVNNFREKVRFELEFPQSTVLQPIEPNIQVEIEPKGKVSIPVPILTKSHGYYYKQLDINAIKENGEEIHFQREIGIAFRGIGAKFHGEDEKTIQLYNGQYFATLDKGENSILTGRKKKASHVTLLTPKLGKPYTEELSKAKPTAIEYIDGTGFIGVKVSYAITSFPSIKLHLILKLFGEGILENYYEIENVLDVKTEKPIYLNQSIYLGLDQATIPYHGAMVEMNDSIGNSYEEWDDSFVSENWLFVNDDKDPIGMCWHPNDNIHFGSWYNYLEHHLGEIEGKSTVQTNPIYFSIGAFHDVDSFRSFASQSVQPEHIQTVNHLNVTLENNNPFVDGEKVIVKVSDHKSNYLHGGLALSLLENKASGQFDREEKKTEWITELPLVDTPAISIVKAISNLDATVLERKTLAIKKTNSEVRAEISPEQGYDSWTMDNGIIQIKAAPEFFPAIYSLTYEGQEWLDTSFPTIQPKLWWNPWSGGLWSGLSSIRPYSLAKEKSTAEFAKMIDNKENEWQGIKLTTVIEENEKYKGLKINQYYLLLPGCPVLCQVSEINQETGTYFNEMNWQTAGFFKPSKRLEDNWARLQDQKGNWTKIVAGKGENESNVAQNLIIGSNERKEVLQIISNSENTLQDTYINKEVLVSGAFERITIPSGNTMYTKPIFYLFNDFDIPELAQSDLKEIRFN